MIRPHSGAHAQGNVSLIAQETVLDSSQSSQPFPDPLSLPAPCFAVPCPLRNVTQLSGDRRLRIQSRPSGLLFCFSFASTFESGFGSCSCAPSFLRGLDIAAIISATIVLQRPRRCISRWSIVVLTSWPLHLPRQRLGSVESFLFGAIRRHGPAYHPVRLLRVGCPIRFCHTHGNAVPLVSMA